MKSVDKRAGDDLVSSPLITVEPGEIVGVDAFDSVADLSSDLGGGVLVDQRLIGCRWRTGQLVGLAAEPSRQTHGHHQRGDQCHEGRHTRQMSGRRGYLLDIGNLWWCRDSHSSALTSGWLSVWNLFMGSAVMTHLGEAGGGQGPGSE